ncbi:transposase [Streptomyces sp. TG1A-60]|uniref:transposase n=1 Tax=Streptomyces sp. TG1A-60 TaxID=3129111 RepID=UPI0030D0B51F
MAEKRRKFTAEFREGSVRIVTETGKPAPETAKDLGINETTLASWVSRAKRAERARPEVKLPLDRGHLETGT